MKETLLQFAGYNIWANKRIIETMLLQTGDAVDTELVSSFPSLRKTVYHTWSAESIWLQRLQLKEQPIWMERVFEGNFEEACTQWQQTSRDLLEFVEKQYDDRGLAHVVEYYSMKKEHFKSSTYSILQHIFNHGTYHRGQLVTMLRQLGETKIPEIDLIIYTRR